MRIDSHQHFWNYDPVKDAWITPDMKAIRNDFLPNDLHPLLKENSIDGSVAVQVDQSEDETGWLLQRADQHSFIRGIVGWVKLSSADINERLSYFAQFKKIKGFRHIVQSEPDGFLLQKDFQRGIRALVNFNYTYDILVYPNQLDDVIRFVRQFPDQKFIIDHLAKPAIKQGSIEPWKKQIAALASFENVYCKLSGMVTEADWRNWKPGDFVPYLDIVLVLFGSKRLLYGSDWPVCLLASSYHQQLSIVEEYISSLSPAEKGDIMGANAVQFYNL